MENVSYHFVVDCYTIQEGLLTTSAYIQTNYAYSWPISLGTVTHFMYMVPTFKALVELINFVTVQQINYREITARELNM